MATVLVVGVEADCLAEPRPRNAALGRVGSRTRTDFRERPGPNADTRKTRKPPPHYRPPHLTCSGPLGAEAVSGSKKGLFR